MAENPPTDLVLNPLQGKPRTLAEQLVTFQLLFVALDPFTNESAWILPTTTRVLHSFQEADVRVALVVTAKPDECRMFLGPWAKELMTFADPDRSVVKAFGLERLPAIVHVASDATVASSFEGWDGIGWRGVVEPLAKMMHWVAPTLPQPRDPQAFDGTPAAG